MKNEKLMNVFFSNSKLISKIYLLLLIFLLTIIYYQSFSFNLIFFDDDSLIEFIDSGLPVYEKIAAAFTSNYLGGQYYRPVTLTTLITDFEFRGNLFSVFHLSNFLVHLSVSILLFFIIKRAGYTVHISIISALIFALNTIHINAVGWIAGRGDLLAALFSLLGLYSVQKYLSSQKLFLIIFATLVLLLAILSKEAAIAVPVLIVLFYFIENRKFEFDRGIFNILLMFIIITGVYFGIRFILPADVHINKFAVSSLIKNISILPETLTKFFIPVFIKPLASYSQATTIIGVVILMILILIPVTLNKINKLRYYLGLLWFILLMIPGMLFRTMQQDGFFYWDCRSYLPLIGITLMIAELLSAFQFKEYKKTVIALLVVYFAVTGYLTFIKIVYYKDANSYWTAVKSDYSYSYLPYIALFNYYNSRDNYLNAEQELLTGINLRPEELTLRRTLIDFYLRNNDKLGAFNATKKAITDIPSYSEYLLSNFISLSIELNKANELDSLLKKYEGNNEILEKIKRLIKEKQKYK